MDVLGLVLLLLVGFLVGVAILVAYTVRTLTGPPRRGYGFALARGVPADPGELRFVDRAGTDHAGAAFESYTFRSRGHDLPVWDIRGCHPQGPVVVVTHGWGDSRIVSLCRAPVLLRLASRVILWDLPGHGDAPGRSSLGKDEATDLAALVESLEEKDRPVVLYGHSLGAGVSIEAGVRLGPDKVGAVVAEAPYRRSLTPARNVMRLAKLPYRLNLPVAMAIIRPGFDRVRDAAELRVPLLVIHGDADAICPLEDAEEIARAGRGTLKMIPGAGHVDIFTEPRFAEEAAAALRELLTPRWLPTTADGAPSD